MKQEAIERAKLHFAEIVEEQLDRIEGMKQAEDWIDYRSLPVIRVGFCGGDGIGPIISDESKRVMEFLLADQVKAGKVELVNIEGLTIENRLAQMKAIPDDVLAELKTCHVILKGPTETPQKGDPRGNIESANVSMRRELDLFANVRPVRVPDEGIDWIFFRENTEGAYVLGSRGIDVTEDLAIDFKVITTQGAERIIRLAFEHASKNGINRVTAVTKANVVKTTDGKFSEIGAGISKEYPDIDYDEWYIDIMTAKLLDPVRRTNFRVVVLPNLYGDIITDEAAQLQGGVGTAGSANIGKRYGMFEAIHGSGNRMVDEGRADYADPSSLIRALILLLEHINFKTEAEKLSMAMDICTEHEKKKLAIGRKEGATAAEFCDYLMETIQDPGLKAKWESFQS
ncbi:isocitrate/isopropylmalate family dehydrogenase [candidate division KSB1 bacterium]